MSVFDSADFDAHEEVVFVNDPQTGLRAIIAIHSTARGPALGGCRMYPYPSEADAIRDVLRLSRGMSYKAAIAGVALGGGKSVIIGDARRQKTEPLLRAMGRTIEALHGRYITGEDIGTNTADMRIMRRETRAVSCLDEADGGYGDPAPLTALGVLQAIFAGLSVVAGSDDLHGVTIAVQGVGNVGLNLCRQLTELGARLIVCDPEQANAKRAEAMGATVVAAEDIYDVSADVFAPCAIGATVNEATIPRLKVKLVAGAANNQLARMEDAEHLQKRGIAYVPDYAANGGGLISCAAEWYRTDPALIRDDVIAIRQTCLEILAEATAAGITTTAAADLIAERRLGRASWKARLP